ncbi:hypothetical protein J4462_04090 [Candidatus Pacearchaeota archaeon]|nr:hypothetical protein [Candidatus Pacearchaeota archaeon]
MSKLIWIVIIVILIIVGFFVFRGGDTDENSFGGEENQIEEVSIDGNPDSEFSDLETSNEVFDEIDSALEFVE